MCPLVMPFEGIGVKEYNGAEETWHLCAQMDTAHMSTYGSVGRQGSLRAPLNLPVIDLVGVSYIET